MKAYVKPEVQVVDVTSYCEILNGFIVCNSVGYDENLAKPGCFEFEFEEENDNVIDATRFSIWEPQETNPDEE